MATLQGVYSASVLDNRDPEGLARVLVRVSPDATNTSELWARVATMMAGRNRGTWFMPEVGDEVLVAFERGDSRAPCVIGALWNGKARPPSAGDPSGVKLIRSRNGLTLRFRDATDNTNSVLIETPGGQRITLQDSPGSVRVEDGNGNAVTLTTSGVAVHASSRVSVSASAVDINAGAVTINSAMCSVSGVVKCDTLISNSVVSASYTPGAGNVW
jgi:uncharacterized protein involved in type VI secretion and phage assembly